MRRKMYRYILLIGVLKNARCGDREYPLIIAALKNRLDMVKYMIESGFNLEQANAAKEMIYSRLRITKLGPGYCHFPSTRDEQYFKQLTAEKVVTRYSKGFPVRRWEKPGLRKALLPF